MPTVAKMANRKGLKLMFVRKGELKLINRLEKKPFQLLGRVPNLAIKFRDMFRHVSQLQIP